MSELCSTDMQTLDPSARLLFALDATASRQTSWNQAQDIQSEMFRATEQCGGLRVQLCYYRGEDQFTATPWVQHANALSATMAAVTCLRGYTQIEKLLRYALQAHTHTPLKAIVFVGDAVEEDVDVLCQLAENLHQCHVPLYAFQEGSDPFAAAAIHQLAGLSGGMHLQFNRHSPRTLAELLGAVAAWAAGGQRALAHYVERATADATQAKNAENNTNLNNLNKLSTALRHAPLSLPPRAD
ncbi:MAG: VWA domain-containing protein [Gammaproteobacteria bacterium]